MESKDENAFEDVGRKSELFLNGLIAGRENTVKKKKKKVYFILLYKMGEITVCLLLMGIIQRIIVRQVTG